MPGRTFIRGFVRNYARLFNLDAATLLSLLPDATRASGLEAPELHATSTVRGELPDNGTTKRGAARWVIPLLLIAIIAGVLWYEWHRGALPGLSGSTEAERALSPTATDSSSVPLPSPTVSVPLTTTSPSADTLPATPGDAASTAGRGSEPSAAAGTTLSSPSTPASSASPSATAASVESAGAAEAVLSFTFSAPSWVEVHDATGAILSNRLNAANSTRTITGKPPFIIVIGNANRVQLAFDGHKIDLAPFTEKNIARLSVR